MSDTKGLSGGEVVRQAYERLIKELKGEPQRLPHELWLVIADDSDHHRSRTGYMKYEAGHLVTVGERRMFLAVGEACGDYPARPYDCDLMALPVTWDWQGPADILTLFDKAPGRYITAGHMPFAHTALLAMASGELRDGGSYARFEGPIKAALADSELRQHLIQPVARDPRYLAASDLQPVVAKPARYAPAIVEPLRDRLISIFSA